MVNSYWVGKVAGFRHVAAAAVAITGACLGAGCGMLSRSGGEATLKSIDSSAAMTTRLETRIYTRHDSETVDLYMTDLPPGVWNAGADVSDMSGVLVHVHMFIRPRAGRTPIANTATTATIRCLVLANGEVGVYGGGGFFMNGDEPGEPRFGGSVHNATLRLVSATGGFEDRLGSCYFSGQVSGALDDAAAVQMQQALRTLVGETALIEYAGR